MRTIKIFLFITIFSNTLMAQQVLPIITEKKMMIEKSAGKESSNFNEQDKIFILGSGSTDALELSKITAAGGLSMAAKPIKRLTLFLNFNFGGNVVKREKADSVYLSSFYFPDIASTAFSGSFNFSLLPTNFKSKETKKFDPNAEQQLLIAFDGSVQERNINRDTLVYNLNITNFNVGPKYQWIYSGRNDNNAVFTVGLFYNRVFINDNSKRDFNALFNPAGNGSVSIPSGFQGISGLISVQFNSAMVYFRTYTDLDRGKDLSFSIGIKAVGKFFSF